jgi:hypothetical protein
MKKTKKINCKKKLSEELEKLPRYAPDKNLNYEEVKSLIKKICVEYHS